MIYDVKEKDCLIGAPLPLIAVDNKDQETCEFKINFKFLAK
jgi:hypothetical protein